ncbi:MAG: DEAD/DEAH box helicase family protein [Nanoarchaeota archaeon]
MHSSEAETRKNKIDPLLKRIGWKAEYIREEVNPIKSDFKRKEYTSDKQTIERGVDRFIDYLFLDQDHSPLALIEAKKTSASVGKGEIQARTYREDIEKHIGIKIPIFLTNGDTWYYMDDLDRTRQVKLPFSQKDLHRMVSLMKKRKDPSHVKINAAIVDRRRGIEATKMVLEHFSKGYRNALINMATGTGKTRVAMAIIDGLIKSDYVQKVLFVVDRISLGNQAKEKGFKKFFPDSPVCELNEEGYSESARFYVSTVQTLMSPQRPRGKFYEQFGTGAFDLIIYDEAHRSYYDKNNDIFKYFDALKIGLTATPSSDDSKDTFELFECEKGKPTVRYNYEEAVRDGVLAPYSAEIIETNVLSLGIEGKKLSKDLQQRLKEQEQEPEKFQTPGSKFEKFFTDEKTNELIIREFLDRCYNSDDKRPCKSIFFCASVRHAESLERLFRRLYPALARDVKVITSDKSRYMDEVKRFGKRDSPRIALSVGVLDTGIDIPEVMNLVFVKPVISPIRFWQMLGRGTRNLSACDNKDWLPTNSEGRHIKENFLILDFKFGTWSNVLEHQLSHMNQRSASVDAKTRIFLAQVDTLKKKLTDTERAVVEKQIRDAVREIDVESPLVIEKREIIKKVVSSTFDLREHIALLKDKIVPLLIYSKSENAKVYAFISQCIKLYDPIKEHDKDKIAKVQEYVVDHVDSIWDKNLDAIKVKRDDLVRIQKEPFWEEITFEDVDFLVRDIAPLMIFYEEAPKRMIQINAPDAVLNVQTEVMKLRKESTFKEIIEHDALIRKLKAGEGVTSEELFQIEAKLRHLDPRITIENVQQTKDFVLFLRELIELKGLPDPHQMIKWEFDKYVASKNEHYTVEQLKFLRLLEEVFIRAKRIELKDLAEHPLADARPLDIFSKEQLVRIVQKCNNLKWK